MLTNDEVIMLLNGLPVRSYKYATNKEPMKLTQHQADALGMKSRNILRIVKVAIQAISDKLFIQEIKSDNVAELAAVEQWLTVNRFETLQRDLYKLIVRDGLAYVMVKYEAGNPSLALVESYDGRTGATSYYDPQTKKELFVVNVWYAGATRNLDIYFPDRIEKYTYDADTAMWKTRLDTEGEQWPIDWTDSNNAPLGIALVRFDITESDIIEAVQLQTDINEAIIDLLATSRTMGWPQRVLKNASQETYLLNQYNQPILDFGTNYPIPRKIELTPGSILMLQNPDSSLDQLDQVTPNTTVLDVLRSLFSQVTTVPNHYFTGDWPSGIALQNSEIRLDSKVEDHQSRLTPSLQVMFMLMLNVSNTFGDTRLDTSVVMDIQWFPPQIETEDIRMERQKTTSQVVFQLKSAQVISTETAVRMLHPDWDESAIQTEIAKINAENSIAGI